ncbi:hypothetical protein KEM54_004563 [Ascosphaera aggregata]|nr:hypothetical protein KEM54_004563 [Ascosphaera aggregata]
MAGNLQIIAAYGSKEYRPSLDSFDAQQQHDVHPQCVITPTANSEVSATILLSRLSGCPFAAKSKGHAQSRASPHISKGITVWLKEFSEVTLNEDKSIASVGIGLTWAEVITASGRVVTARHGHLGDKGTSNNYGIVTKFNLYTVPKQLVCSGSKEYGQNQKSEIIRAFAQTANDASTDGKAQQWMSLTGPTIEKMSSEPSRHAYAMGRATKSSSSTGLSRSSKRHAYTDVSSGDNSGIEGNALGLEASTKFLRIIRLQDVIASYGDSNGVRLRRVAMTYDQLEFPKSFKKGGFKLSREALSDQA